MFQDFSAPKNTGSKSASLEALREQFQELGINALWVPRTDEYQGEYVPPCAERLAWLTGFTGSAGLAIIAEDTAAFFTDGRYVLQANNQLDTEQITPFNTTDMPATEWLKSNTKTPLKLGVDPWLITLKDYENLAKVGEVILLKTNPIDEIWKDRPAKPCSPVRLQEETLTGKSRADKISALQQELKDQGTVATILTQPESIAWAFNIRGNDVPHTPLCLSYAVVPSEGKPTLFIDDRKIEDKIRADLEKSLIIANENDFEPTLKALSGIIQVDPNTCQYAVLSLLEKAEIRHAQDPCIAPRATKTHEEQNGTRAAHLRDGVAITRFLAWLDSQPVNTLTEISAAQKLESLRHEEGKNDGSPLLDISFDTISGVGSNGAIIHYRVTEETNKSFPQDTLYLVDSGGQYQDGTTDITRTIAVGTPTADMIKHFTLVLKGMIAVSCARFPKGTSGTQLDILARAALWKNGLDYDHGTGHGVGSYLSVHEGPQRISKAPSAALEVGMIISNEPGYYKNGAYGIRIENLVLVQTAEDIDGGDRPMMRFETLTHAPFDKRAIDITLLNKGELDWLNNYHAMVREKILPRLTHPDEKSWLEEATSPLTQ